MTSEFLIVAQQVLELENRAMTPQEIVSVAIREKLFSDKRAGKTPDQTMKSKLSVHIRRNGDNSPFIRTEPGKFFLRHLLEPDQHPYLAKPMTKSTSLEDVLVFDSTLLNNERRFQGIKKAWKRLYSDLLRPNICTYLNRRDAEIIDTHKQLLTYILVTRKGSLLAYKRGNYNRVEDFLRGSDCIGFGGHVSSEDLDLFSSNNMGLSSCVIRELSEELKLPDADRNRLISGEGVSCIGILNDDSTPVGQRHLAFVFRYEVSDDPNWDRPERGEKSITQLRWLDNKLTRTPFWRFEYWSQLCLREYFPKLVKASPAFNIHRKRPLSSPHILCVLGTVGSGKSELTKLLCEEFGYKEINTGRIVATLLGIPSVPETPREIFQKKAWDFIKAKRGPDKLAAAIWDQAITCNAERVLVDGIRQKATLKSLQTLAGRYRIGIIYVHTLPDIAFKFYQEREGKGSSIFDFIKVRKARVESEVEDMISQADAVLYNWIGLNAYKRTIRKMIRELGLHK
jgi:predicted NUDIX family phosphoesterase/dephospho-CoA kinase